MYLDFAVPIPDLPGKIGRFKKGNTIYIRYVVGRKYLADRKYNIPNHKIIGKAVVGDPYQMIPNENFLKYFGDTDLPELKRNTSRSSCLRIGAFLVIRKIMEEYSLPQMFTKYLGAKDCGLFLDLCAYSIICENNAGQYYPIREVFPPILLRSEGQCPAGTGRSKDRPHGKSPWQAEGKSCYDRRGVPAIL